MLSRGLRVQHFCYPTRTRSTGSLPVHVLDPYSKLLPDPTRPDPYPRGYPYPSLSSLSCIVYIPTMLTCLQLGMSYSLISRLLMNLFCRTTSTPILRRRKRLKRKRRRRRRG